MALAAAAGAVRWSVMALTRALPFVRLRTSPEDYGGRARERNNALFTIHGSNLGQTVGQARA